MRYLFLVFVFFASAGFAQQSLRVGDKAPEIVMKGMNGEELKLSSLKGKVVLIDFWASWCKPCRKENPVVVKSYQEYKDKGFKNGDGFTVFSVSLDNNKIAWEKAIKADSLIWPYHVSDLKGWNNEIAVRYGVQSIPQNYLIDGDGVIVAINLRGGALERELKKLKKKNTPFFDFFGFLPPG